MKVELGTDALDLFFQLAAGATSAEIVFTGGEPLLRFSTLMSLVHHAERCARVANISVSFVLKTNGTKINTEVIDFLKGHHLKAVVSIDGTPRSHDKERRGQAGCDTHRAVIAGFKALLNRGVPSVASITVLPSTCGNLLENVQYLHALGAESIDVGPAYGTVQWSDPDVTRFLKGLEDVAAYMLEIRSAGGNLEVGPLYHKSEHVGGQLVNSWGCGAVSTNIAFLPDGRVSGCSSLAMLASKYPNVIIGNVQHGIDEEASSSLLAIAQAGLALRRRCQRCSTSANCAGGCLAINYAQSGKPLFPPRFYCRSMAALPTTWKIAWAN
jgi:uncharacterized protein